MEFQVTSLSPTVKSLSPSVCDNPNNDSEDDGSNSDPEYFFETDPLILRNNTDYQQLLRCQVKLQSQRLAAVKVRILKFFN